MTYRELRKTHNSQIETEQLNNKIKLKYTSNNNNNVILIILSKKKYSNERNKTKKIQVMHNAAVHHPLTEP